MSGSAASGVRPETAPVPKSAGLPFCKCSLQRNPQKQRLGTTPSDARFAEAPPTSNSARPPFGKNRAAKMQIACVVLPFHMSISLERS